MTKAIVDVLQSIVYANDIEIKRLVLDKWFTTKERARIEIHVAQVPGPMMEVIS